MNSRNKDYQTLNEYTHLYFFDYTWENHRRVKLYSQTDLIGKDTDIHELEGIIYASEEINEKIIPITKFQDLLEKYNCKLIYFENFE